MKKNEHIEISFKQWINNKNKDYINQNKKLKNMQKNIFLISLLLIGMLSYGQKRTSTTFTSKKTEVKRTNPSNTKAIIDSLHYDSDNQRVFGTGAITFGAFICIPAIYGAAHHNAGNSISSVKIFLDDTSIITTATLKIFSDTGITQLASQSFVPVTGWNDVQLSTPLSVPTTDMFIGVELSVTGGYTTGLDSSSNPHPNGNWVLVEGHWQHLPNLSHMLTYNWNIRAMISGTVLTDPLPYLNPSTYVFDSTLIDYDATSSKITLKNVGGGVLIVTDMTGLSVPFSSTFNPNVSLNRFDSVSFTIKFTPTIAGAANQEVTLHSNTGLITLNLNGIGLNCGAHSTPWAEDIESGTFPQCWHPTDADGDGYNWNVISENHSSHSGTYSAVSASWNDNALTPDNYLITYKTLINNSNENLHWWAASQDISYPSEHYSVMVSTSGTSPVDFTEIYNETLTDTTFRSRTISLAAYSGQEVYVAFRHWNCTDNFEMKLDDISMNGVSSIDDLVELNPISIFPNPARQKLYVDATQIKSIEIFNLIGSKVASSKNQNVVDVSLLSQGSYLVKVTTDKKISVLKTNIIH